MKKTEYVAFLKYANGGTEAVVVEAYSKEDAIERLNKAYGKQITSISIN